MTLKLPQKTGPLFPPQTGKAKSLVVILHGYGADAHDLFPLSQEWAPSLPETAFIALHAPFSCEGNPYGRQWFSLFDMDASNRSGMLTYWPMEKLVAGGREAAQILNAWIDELLAEYKIGPDKLALVGFSQGAMLAMHVGLRRDKQIAGIVAFSGRLLQPESLGSEIKSKPPVMLRHGDMDEVVPAQNMIDAQKYLEDAGVPADARMDQGMGHSISEQSINEAAQFLTKNLP
ncbi:MAG: phospholipase [Alphaproteobacteria bacterium]|nr:MAG: phospholipase [Alphaproteobacteria bacterium]